MVSDCSSKFGCNKHFGEREMVLVCRAISQDHVTKVSCYFISESPSWKVTILPSLITIGIV